MIRCPHCQGYTRVVNSRPTRQSMRRRRRCRSCGYMWTTYELIADLETLFKAVVKECEPLRRRLRYIEAEIYELGKALRSLQLVAKGQGSTITRGLAHPARQRTWTTLERRNLVELYPNTPAVLLAERFGRTTQAIYQQARKIGLTKERRNASAHEAEDRTQRQEGSEGRENPFASDRESAGAGGQVQERKVDAPKERKVQKDDQREYKPGEISWETPETGSSDSPRHGSTVRSGGSNSPGKYPKKG